ncbi:uncharacterized protein LY89DRAFT_575586 [Mollisia scopiformis]|uniref:YTH domain-containing protein n=1 Tax=Mollisia scopiformis TaxID=149040 RepID=A0A194XQD6_MOLSC|nr:uncharacterized protein LY89DRAFT_575586 [Mollisia scopiformis]KUJ22408.1 hypothetical protein LY89DRAFT_575586 [Mollisia scopiformis]
MTDPPARSQPAGDLPNSSQSSRPNVPQLATPVSYEGNDPRRAYHGSSQPNLPQGSFAPVPQFPQQQNSSPGRQDSFGMTSLGSALPEVFQGYGSMPSQRYAGSHATSSLQYHPQSTQYTAPAGMTSPSAMPYNIQYQPQYQGMYAQSHNQSPTNTGTASGLGNQFYQGQIFMGQPQQAGGPYFVQPNQYGAPNPMFMSTPSTGQYGLGRGYGAENRLPNQFRGTEYLEGHPAGTGPGRSSSIASSGGQSSVVRGPPRKPRQSGHAIWIGNLPPHTDLMSLVLHVCKETLGLESLFLISKSNCAFANFKDEESCAAAQAKIHDSRFQTVRLVSRLRRSSGAGVSAATPTGPAALAPPANPPVARTPSPETDTKSKDAAEAEAEVSGIATADDVAQPKDKFFVVKSLTVEDLELSVRNGIWATQSHNEEILNKAYKSADNVYLVFSANKSGEYFGYAKMTSPINDDPAAAIEFAPKAHTVEDPELPKAIPTPATEFAPKGRIIDDSARGTIFWEVERDDGDGSEDEDETHSNRSDQDAESTARKAWGKPFQVEWVSTTRLPFYRTRGLRNPWNSNREVKIARDGTELETAVGRRLLGLFHRLPSPVGPQIPIMGGYHPQMRFP